MAIARWLAAAIIGFIGTWVVTTMTSLGFSPDEAMVAVTGLELLITGALLFGGTALIAQLLKMGFIGKIIDPGGWADRQWRKSVAPEVRRLSASEASRRIAQGTIEHSTNTQRKYPDGF